MSERLTKFDQYMLLGDLKNAKKIALQRVRSARTQVRNIHKQLDASDEKWPNSKSEREVMRRQMEEIVFRMNELEKIWESVET